MTSAHKNVYSGHFDHTLDDKNRLTIPSLWRWTHADTETFLAIPHPDGYIAVLPPARVSMRSCPSTTPASVVRT